MKPAPTPRSFDAIALSACLGSLVFWSFGPIFIKLLTGPLDGWTQNALRYTVGFLVWLPFLAYQGYRQQLAPGLWRRALWPTIANILMQSTWALSFYHADPGLITLITKTNVLWIAGFSIWLFPDERPLLKQPGFWIGLLLALTGISGVLLGGEGLFRAHSWLGFVIPLGSAFFGALYTISVRACFHNTDARQGFAVVSLYTTLGLWILTALFGHPEGCMALEARQWCYIIISGITAIALGHTLFYVAVRRLGAAIPPLVVLAQPFFVLLLSKPIFNEQLTGHQLAFGIVLLLGAGCAIWTQQRLKTEKSGTGDQ